MIVNELNFPLYILTAFNESYQMHITFLKKWGSLEEIYLEIFS